MEGYSQEEYADGMIVSTKSLCVKQIVDKSPPSGPVCSENRSHKLFKVLGET